MAKFTNTGEGARGIVTADGNTIWVEAGETVDLTAAQAKDAKLHDDIKEGAKAAKEAAAEDDTAGA